MNSLKLFIIDVFFFIEIVFNDTFFKLSVTFTESVDYSWDIEGSHGGNWCMLA